MEGLASLWLECVSRFGRHCALYHCGGPCRLSVPNGPKNTPMGYRTRKSVGWLFLAAGVLFGLAGCEDSAKTPVQVRPAQIPLPSQDQVLPSLPLTAQPKFLMPLALQAPDGAERLATESQAAFEAGEQDFQAGHLVKAREEFDEALDQLLARGI